MNRKTASALLLAVMSLLTATACSQQPSLFEICIAEMRNITNPPIRYLVYSHHHFDHIAGGKPLKDAGATIIAHERAKERLALLKDPNTPRDEG